MKTSSYYGRSMFDWHVWQNLLLSTYAYQHCYFEILKLMLKMSIESASTAIIVSIS